MLRESDSEFKQLLDTLKRLGIKFSLNYDPTKKDWQRIILNAGFNITALSCTVVEVGDTEYLFSDGQLVWDSRGKGYGPSGLFMFSRNKKTRRVTQRVYKTDNSQVLAIGLDAVKRTYSNYEWGPRKEAAFR